jgi:hypothetical protein
MELHLRPQRNSREVTSAWANHTGRQKKRAMGCLGRMVWSLVLLCSIDLYCDTRVGYRDTGGERDGSEMGVGIAKYGHVDRHAPSSDVRHVAKPNTAKLFLHGISVPKRFLHRSTAILLLPILGDAQAEPRRLIFDTGRIVMYRPRPAQRSGTYACTVSFDHQAIS